MARNGDREKGEYILNMWSTLRTRILNEQTTKIFIGRLFYEKYMCRFHVATKKRKILTIMKRCMYKHNNKHNHAMH